jgi:hypothetical protein
MPPEAAVAAETIEKPVTPVAGADKGAGGKAPATNGADRGAATNGKGAVSAEAEEVETEGDGSLLDDAGEAEDDVQAKTPSDWPEDWRERLAGDDEKYLRELKRFASPQNYAKSAKALRQKLSSGEYKRALAEDASPEQVAEWRKEMGLPEKPEDYQPPQIAGHEWTEADKPVLGALFERLHKVNADQKVANEVLSFYAEARQMASEAQAEADRTFKQEAEDALRAEYGNEYRPHLTLYSRILKDQEVFPGDSGAILSTARTADGQRLINHPDFAKAMIALGREKYGAGGMISGGEARSMASREAEIRQVMKTNFAEYIAKGMDKELTEIMNKKGGQASPGYAD